MTAHLSKELEQFVHDAVRAGRYASEDDVLNDALERLRRQTALARPGSEGSGTAPVTGQSRAPGATPMSEDDFKRQLLQSGLISSLPVPVDAASRPGFQPISIDGEPLSETIIRERR
jgi:Arc/MetJ-type ribon-helix-helix transcriptional regulator